MKHSSATNACSKMNFTSNEMTSTLLYCFFIIIMPFLLFYSIIPFLSSLTMSSDYLLFSIKYQMELLFSLKTGTFPLYVPGFAAGHSSSALTLGQIYHPLSHIASIMPGYWDGKAVEWNTFFKLLSLGITQLVLFFFLRKLRLNSLFSFLLSFVTVYNLKILDLFRHGAPLEAYTGHLLLCALIGLYFIQPTRWEGPLSIITATYLLVCSGHPEEMYYGLLGAGLFACVAPFFISAMLPDRKIDMKVPAMFYLKTGAFLFLGLMLSSAYTVPFYFDFVSDNDLRVGHDYLLADHNLDTIMGTINNFVLPLRSLVYGAFGGSSLILIAFLVPVLLAFKVKIPRSVWVIWGLLIIMFLFIQGKRTPVHRLIWEYLPFASSIRTAGRISIIIPVFIMLMLAWTIQLEPFLLRLRRASVFVRPYAVLAGFALLLSVIYYLVYVTGYHVLSSEIFIEEFRNPAGAIGNIPYLWIELLIVLAGISLLISLIINGLRTGTTAGTIGLLLILISVTQVGIVVKYRSTIWTDKRTDSPTYKEMQEQKKIKLDYIHYPGGGLYSSVVTNQRQRSFMEPFLGKIFTSIVPVETQEDAYDRMESERQPHQLFIEGFSHEKARMLNEVSKDVHAGFVELLYSSFNRLKFQVNAQSPAIFGLSYPYSGHWNAAVNGVEVPVYRVNGAAHGIEIPEGTSIIEFRYLSRAAFWGMVLSCTALALIGIIFCIGSLNGLLRISGIIVVVGIAAGVFMHWHNSLYSGDNLETKYAWTGPVEVNKPNLAYGKKTWIEPPIIGCKVCGHDLSNTRVVDGERSHGSGFLTRSNNMSLILDLYRPEKVDTIIVYKSELSRDDYFDLLNKQDSFIPHTGQTSESPSDSNPFRVELSDDGNTWQIADYTISAEKGNGPLNIIFNKPDTTRYVMLRIAGGRMLSLDEVEIYAK